MKFSAERQPLLDAIIKASLPIRRGDVAVLECLKFEAADRLLLTGSCREIEVTAEAKAAITQIGTTLVNAADIKAVVAASPKGGILTIDATETDMTITGKGVSVRLMTIDPINFPQATSDANDEVVSDIDILGLCAPFAATSEVRFNIHGVCIDGDAAVATDSNMIARTSVHCARSGAIIPIQAIPVIRKLNGESGRLWVGETSWRIEAEGVRACGRLIDGKFPGNWRSLICDGVDLFKVGADAMTAALTASTLGRAEQIVLCAASNGVSLSGEKFKGGHIEAKIDCIANIEADFTVVISASKLRAALGAFGDVDISFSAYDGKLRLDADNGLTAAMTVLLDRRTSLPEMAVAA